MYRQLDIIGSRINNKQTNKQNIEVARFYSVRERLLFQLTMKYDKGRHNKITLVIMNIESRNMLKHFFLPILELKFFYFGAKSLR